MRPEGLSGSSRGLRKGTAYAMTRAHKIEEKYFHVCMPCFGSVSLTDPFSVERSDLDELLEVVEVLALGVVLHERKQEPICLQ